MFRLSGFRLGNLLNIRLVSFIAVSAFSAYKTNGAVIGNTYQSCLDFAASFDNTCPDASDPDVSLQYYFGQDIDQLEGETVTCDALKNKCPVATKGLNYLAGSQIYSQSTPTAPCTWVRKLCVSCIRLPVSQTIPAGVSVEAMIRVLGNNMPNHCFGTENPPIPTVIDFAVAFNAQLIDQNKKINGAIYPPDQEEFVCNLLSFSDTYKSQYGDVDLIGDFAFDIPYFGLPTYTNAYVMDEATGMALNGVLFKAATGAQGYDRVQPRDPSETKTLVKKTFDQCLGSTDTLDTVPEDDSVSNLDFPTYDKSSDGVYHYTTYTPCIYGGELTDLSYKCETDPTCKKSPTLIFDKITKESDRVVKPMGLAKDGRIMYGPYRNADSMWDSCDVDVCNGRPTQGIYGYYATDFFPYTVGCWGPGVDINNRLLFPSCTSYPRQCPRTEYLKNSAQDLSQKFFGPILSIAFLFNFML